MPRFTIKAMCGKARAGVLHTTHGDINTPLFMPVATKGSVKHLTIEEIESTGTQCMIANAFVLSLKPGTDVIRMHGGLHRFMKWDKGLFTDSGGFQVLSEQFCLGISNEGVNFRDPFSGKASLFTPEMSIEVQNELGSDVVMCLDDVPLAGATEKRLLESTERTSVWAKRCVAVHRNSRQLLFGICQGGVNPMIRKKSASEIGSMDFDGYAIGGLVIGEPSVETFHAVEAALPFLPEEKPRYMMGVGSVGELRKAIWHGVDIFDSCFATRTARHGRAFTANGNMNVAAGKFRNDLAPIDGECGCFVCRKHSRAYVHHLFRTREENAAKYLSYHNIWFLQHAIQKIKQEIIDGSFM